MRRTKIICTIGPATSSEKSIEELIQAGMDVARINLSHGTQNEHRRRITLIRRVARRFYRPVAILLDLQGPKLRVGKLKGGKAELKKGQLFTLTTRKIVGGDQVAYADYKGLPREVKTGDRILLDDGRIRLRVLKVKGREVDCQVITSGVLKDQKGINLPGVKLKTPSITDKDRKDLQFGLKLGVDYIAVSFVRSAQDIVKVKRIMGKKGADIPVIAKIEKPEAISSLDEILNVSEGIMVARGDLGVEMSVEKVPLLQKMIIERCHHLGIPVITATQILESMIHSPTPTRAEASDAANAIYDGTDALMLSGETAVGDYPEEAVKLLHRIITTTEEGMGKERRLKLPALSPIFSHEDAIAHAACDAARDGKARAIVAHTHSGTTALLISKYRPTTPIYALSPSEEIVRRVNLYWGVRGYKVPEKKNTDELLFQMDVVLQRQGLAKKGELVAITIGVPTAARGTTNTLMLHRVGRMGIP